MNSRFYGLQGLILAGALVASCKEDPTASLAGGPAGVELEFSVRKVVIDDSALVTAVVRDALGTPLAVVPTFASRSTAIATTSVKGVTELRQVQFYVKGQSYGSTWIVATAGNLTDSMQVQTFPATLAVSGPSAVVSGQTPTYTFTYRSASGRDLTAQVPAATFSSTASAVGSVGATTGVLTAKDFGAVDVIATGPGVDAIGTGDNAEDTIGVRGRVTVLVSPAAFTGTTAGVLEPGGIMKILPDPGQLFDSDTRVFFNRIQVALDSTAGATSAERVVLVRPDSIKVRLDNLRETGKYELVLSRLGAGQLSVGGDSITLTTALFSAEGGTIAPAPLDPGAVVTLTAGSIPFDANSGVFFNGTLQTPLDTQVAAPRRVRISDLAGSGARTTLITRLGANDNARTGTFTVNAPTAFAGTLAPSSGSPAQIVTVKRAASDPAFGGTNDERAFFNGERTFVHQVLADSVKVVVPPLGFVQNPVELLVTRIGASDNARNVAFTNVLPSGNFYNDPYDALGNDFASVATAPEITANGDYYIVLHGSCHDGAGGTDCDDLFTIKNTSTTSGDSLTVQLDWFTGADVDILWCNADCSAFRGNFAGATGDNPESSTVIIPASTEWRLWLNLFDNAGSAATLVRVRVTGKN